MNDRTEVFVRSFPVGKHTVTMTLTRRRFFPRDMPVVAAQAEEAHKGRHQYRSGKVADAYGSKGRFGLIVEM